ncbi:hypothetical protein [Leptospira weilii]|uniref:hypothetical protein n=1 Tax=Leptospira weilii TaxID=28184 RepID=UPI00056A28AB|nr:hypothetical protein [Leptospira weilii]
MGFFDDKRYLVNLRLRKKNDRQMTYIVKKEVIAGSWNQAVNQLKDEYGDDYCDATPVSEKIL